ncbi:MAG: tetratricopeptide repeat protein, partial [Pseudomonadota bacterium]|nr:tetratricopeptide repeat protein [Pseudomonadota bacterium]
RRHGDDPALLLTLARLYQLAGEHEQSAEYFERAIELNPTLEAHRDYGRLLEARGDTAAALRQFSAALEQVAPCGAGPPALTAPAPATEHPA